MSGGNSRRIGIASRGRFVHHNVRSYATLHQKIPVKTICSTLARPAIPNMRTNWRRLSARFFHAVKSRVQRPFFQLQRATAGRFQPPQDLQPMCRLVFQGRQGMWMRRPGMVEVAIESSGKVAQSVRIVGDAVIVYEADIQA